MSILYPVKEESYILKKEHVNGYENLLKNLMKENLLYLKEKQKPEYFKCILVKHTFQSRKFFSFKELKYIDFTTERAKATSIAEKHVRTTTFFYLFLTL